jgi:ornithine cyclodeaminase
VDSLCHFGAGKISELLVKAMLKVRPSIYRVFLVRDDISKGVPEWFEALEGKLEAKVVDAHQAVAEADLVTTATNSRKPVIPPQAALHRLRHLNLIGSNHLGRREISDELARRCLPPDGYLVVDDKDQAKLEAGDFLVLEQSGELTWDNVPTLAQLLVDPAEKLKASKATLTTFKSVGTGLMDLALATGVLRRMGVLSGSPDEGA